MDDPKILAEFSGGPDQIEEAILELKRLAEGQGTAERGGRSKGSSRRGSNEPGSQPPPAAPAAARIAGRLDRAVSGSKLPGAV